MAANGETSVAFGAAVGKVVGMETDMDLEVPSADELFLAVGTSHGGAQMETHVQLEIHAAQEAFIANGTLEDLAFVLVGEHVRVQSRQGKELAATVFTLDLATPRALGMDLLMLL